MGTPRERRSDQAFEHALAKGIEIGVQRVAQVHRRRLVTYSALGTGIICLSIMLVVGLLFRQQAVDQARAESTANCHLVKGVSYWLTDFISSDAQLRRAQAHSRDGSSVQVRIVVDLERLGVPAADLAAAAAASNQASLNTAAHWSNVDVPHLQRLAATNCASGLP